MSYSPGLTSITGNVSVNTTSGVGTPSSGQNLIHVSGAMTGGGTIDTIYTVPASKVFYLFGVCYFKAAASICTVYDTAGNATADEVVKGSTAAAPNDHWNFNTACPIKSYAAGEFVRAASSAAAAATIKIWGILVDA